MPVQIQFRRGTAAAWTTANTLLASGELGLETDTRFWKIGDGVTHWNSLPYPAAGGGVWGAITGTLSAQTDLQTALDAKADASALSDYATTSAVAAGYQPLDSDLTAIAALSTTAYGRAFLALVDAPAARTALSLGTAATAATGDFDAAGAAAAAQAASQPLDSDLTAIAALATTTYGRALLTMADAAALRTAAGLGTLATQSGTFSGTSSGTNTGDETGARLATLHHAASAKSAIVDADEVTGGDSANGFSLIRTLWSDVWTYIKSKADPVYAPKGAATGSGLTMATNKLLGRNTASTGAIEEITLGTGLSMSGTTLNAAGGSPGGSSGAVQGNTSGSFSAVPNFTYDTTTGRLTYDHGTITTALSPFTITETRNNSGITFPGIVYDITETASAGDAKLLDLKIGGNTLFKVFKAAGAAGGSIFIKNGNDNGGSCLASYADEMYVNNATNGARAVLNTGRVNASDVVSTGAVTSGGLAIGTVSKTGSYTATTNDHTILCDATSGAIVITGYATSGNSKRRLTIKKIDSSGNTVTFDPNASEQVDGATTKVLSSQWSAITVQVNAAGTAWNIVSVV